MSTDHGQALGEVAAGLGVVALRVLGMAAAGGNDLALVEEVVRHRDRLVEQTAGVVPQVEHDAGELVARLGLKRFHRRPDAAIGLFVEAGDADIADVVADRVAT